MTRKDYVLIAQAIKREVEYGHPDSPEQRARRSMARSIAYELAQDNPRFDRERFMQACGFEG